MKAVTVRFLHGMARSWWWLRQVSGDAAYDNYVRQVTLRLAARPADEHESVAGENRGLGRVRLLSAKEFYLDTLSRRYSGVSRCC